MNTFIAKEALPEGYAESEKVDLVHNRKQMLWVNGLAIFLAIIMLLSMAVVPFAAAPTSGVTFTYRKSGREIVLVKMKEVLNRCFDMINDQSLDELMIQTVGDDLAQQANFMTEIANSVIGSAHPLFSQDAAAAVEEKAIEAPESVEPTAVSGGENEI